MSVRRRTPRKVLEASRDEAKGEKQHSEAEAHEVLVSLENAIWGRDWGGRAGLSDRSVYVALLRVAWRHGTLIPSGVRVSVALRPLADEAGVSKPTVTAAIKRLMLKHKLRRRAGRGEGPKSGAFVLLADPRPTYPLAGEYQRRTGVSPELPEWASSARVPLRWGPGRMNKTKEFLLDALRRLGEATEYELAVAMGQEKRPRDLRPHLDELVRLEVVRRCGDRYALDEHAVISLHTVHLRPPLA